MHPTLFKIGPLSIHSYGLAVAVAFAAGILLAIHFARKEKIAADVILDLALYFIIASVAGARFFYVIGQWEYFYHNPVEIFALQNGGLVFLGGLLFSLITVTVYAGGKKLSLLKLLDVIFPGAALAYSIGRIGCFLNGCCFGLPTNLPWGMVFPPGSLAASFFPNARLHPTQLYSSFIIFLCFIFLAVLYDKKKFDGQIFFTAMLLYSTYRFLIEFLRFSPIHWIGLTPSQWLALIIFAFGAWGLVYYQRKRV